MNSNEMFKRDKKAARLAAVLFECGATAEDVFGASRANWEMCALAATNKLRDADPDSKETVHPPNSDATVYAVAEHLNRLYAAAADEKTEGEWLDKQMNETGADRCPPRD